MKKLHKNMSLEDLKRRIIMRSHIEHVSKMISQLSNERKLLFNMYFIHGYRIYSLAKLCNVNQGTISRRLQRIGNELFKNITNKSNWRR